jgi:hypothetical protein
MTKNKFEALVETALARLGWVCTDSQPCNAVAHAREYLPYGWVEVSDDSGTWGYADALEIVDDLDSIELGTEYGEDLGDWGRPPILGSGHLSSHDWPEDLISFELIEEGSVNDNPDTLVTVVTNAGIRYAAGPHGVSFCALSDWFSSGMKLAKTREAAIESSRRTDTHHLTEAS